MKVEFWSGKFVACSLLGLMAVSLPASYADARHHGVMGRRDVRFFPVDLNGPGKAARRMDDRHTEKNIH